jgi:hypothetical protein
MSKMCIPCGGFKKLSINDDVVPDSAFLFACRLDVFGILIAAGCWALELSVLIFFYQVSQESHPNTAYVGLVPSCDEDRRRMVGGGGDFGADVMRRSEVTPTCSEDFSVSDQAFSTALVILILSIGPDFVGGLNLALRRRSVVQMITGCAMMGLAITALVAAAAFVGATAQDDVTVYTNCVAILFVLDMDEQVFSLIKMLFPTYTEETIKAITEGDDSSAIGIVADVRFAELMGRKEVTVETEMSSAPQQSPRTPTPAGALTGV